ncbi:MAG TPA: hypothetical protein VHW67_07375 [Solirubrobacteraceae bacterium]|jgi:hypothetical protein|nr:hypothetical protein [Solirubrobacteraceae bacterium]
MSSPNGKSPVPQSSEADTRQIPAVSAAIVPVGGLAGARPGIDGSMAELRRRRYELAERVAELTWDLGGLTYEMAIRDHYRLDVLARRAAELQQADAQLGEVQRLLSGAESGVHGQCRSCGAVHSRGASFCWHCGAGLLEEARPTVLAGEPEGSKPATD